jgi:hypothetical protein
VGKVAFLLTDGKRSTRAREAEPDAMAAAMDRHNAIADAAVGIHGERLEPAAIVGAGSLPAEWRDPLRARLSKVRQ